MSFLSRVLSDDLIVAKPTIEETVRRSTEEPTDLDLSSDKKRLKKKDEEKKSARNREETVPKKTETAPEEPSAPSAPSEPTERKNVNAPNRQEGDRPKSGVEPDLIGKDGAPDDPDDPDDDDDGSDDGGDGSDGFAEDGKTRIGKKNLSKKRIDYLRSQKPHLFIISGSGQKSNEDKLRRFFQKAENIIGNPKFVELLHAGKFGLSNPKPIDLVFAYIVVDQVVKQLTDIAKASEADGVYSMQIPFSQQIVEGRPFDKLDWKALAPLKITSNELLPVLQKAFERLKGKSGGGDGDRDIGALQLTDGVPLDYCRFLSKENRRYAIYLGDHPPGAGLPGVTYVVCSKKEGDYFIDHWLPWFNPPGNFDDSLQFNTNIGQEFKSVDPKPWMSSNCIVLTHETKFDPNELVSLKETPEKVAAKFDFFKKKKGQKPKDKETMLDILTAFALVALKSKFTKPGSYIKGRVTIGNTIVNFSRDFKKAILWGSIEPLEIKSVADIKEMLPFVKDVNLDFKG